MNRIDDGRVVFKKRGAFLQIPVDRFSRHFPFFRNHHGSQGILLNQRHFTKFCSLLDLAPEIRVFRVSLRQYLHNSLQLHNAIELKSPIHIHVATERLITTRLILHEKENAPSGNRTPDLPLTRRVLYQLS